MLHRYDKPYWALISCNQLESSYWIDIPSVWLAWQHNTIVIALQRLLSPGMFSRWQNKHWTRITNTFTPYVDISASSSWGVYWQLTENCEKSSPDSLFVFFFDSCMLTQHLVSFCFFPRSFLPCPRSSRFLHCVSHLFLLSLFSILGCGYQLYGTRTVLV